MSVWKDFVTAALLGTERGTSPELPAALEPVLSAATGLGREAEFLTRAGALSLWRTAGWKPPRTETPGTLSEPDSLPLVSRASAGHLRTILGNRCAAVLPEWLSEVARLGRRVPPELLPALLERARNDRGLRPLVLAAGGQRAAWLAAQNAAWAFAPADTPELWETGTRDQRVAILRTLRANEPVAAREKVDAAWKTEPTDARAAFLGELAANLSPDDEPFLEAALDDRSKEVRRVAVDLLARLPESQFVDRMKQRAIPMLVLKAGKLLARASLEITLPPEPDAAATRDGLDPKTFGQQKKLGEKAVLLVLILSAVPPAYWSGTFGQSPASLVKAAEKHEFASVLVTGWAWAALRHRDAGWAEALLNGPIPLLNEFLPSEPLSAVLAGPRRLERLSVRIRSGALDKPGSGDWVSCAAELGALDDWPPQLCREILSVLRRAAANGIPWHLRSSVETLLLRIPPALLPEAIGGWPTDKEGVSGFIELLSFRHDALTALHQPN